MKRALPPLLGALALALPAPQPGQPGLMAALCGLPGVRLLLPLGRELPETPGHGCCHGAACHAGCERKRQWRGAVPAD
jgi:hypothetical protein